MGLRLGLGRLGITEGARNIRRLLWPLGAASPGMWIAPRYVDDSFQDSAGTTALSAIGTVLDTSNPIGLILDRKAGATSPSDPGIHLSQSTSAARAVASARKNELVGTAALATQNVTSKALQYVLSFWGTGTVTLSGTSTAGPLVGTGAGNRVSLTFTPTAGTLTLTVSGTVTDAQLEVVV